MRTTPALPAVKVEASRVRRPAVPVLSRAAAWTVIAAGLAALGAGIWLRGQPPLGEQTPAVAATPAAVHGECVAGQVVTVRTGDTLWDLASRCAGPRGDARRWVEALRAANGLSGRSPLQPGQALRIPSDPSLARPLPAAGQ